MTEPEPTSTADDAQPHRRRGRVRLIVSVCGSLAMIGLLVYLLASRGHDVGRALDRASAGDMIVITALALLTLVARTEAVVASLSAMGARPRRSDIHAANSLTFLAAVVNHNVSSVVRGALMRRIDRERSPTIPQMVMVDVSTTLIEGLLVTVLVVVSASALNLAWWIPALLIAGALTAVAAAIIARQRLARYQIFRGLDVLAHSRQRTIVTGLMVLVIAAQVVRTLVALRSVDLDPSLGQAVATFVAAGVLSTLLAGPGAGAAGAPLIVFGHHSLAAAGAAGLLLTASVLVAGIIYALLGGPAFLWRLHAAYSA